MSLVRAESTARAAAYRAPEPRHAAPPSNAPAWWTRFAAHLRAQQKPSPDRASEKPAALPRARVNAAAHWATSNQLMDAAKCGKGCA